MKKKLLTKKLTWECVNIDCGNGMECSNVDDRLGHHAAGDRVTIVNSILLIDGAR